MLAHILTKLTFTKYFYYVTLASSFKVSWKLLQNQTRPRFKWNQRWPFLCEHCYAFCMAIPASLVLKCPLVQRWLVFSYLFSVVCFTWHLEFYAPRTLVFPKADEWFLSSCYIFICKVNQRLSTLFFQIRWLHWNEVTSLKIET